MRKRFALLTVLAVAVLALVGAGSAQASTKAPHPIHAAYTACYDGADPNGFNPNGNSTKATATIYNRFIELRYNTNRCAWGKISQGNPGDEVWVERSTNGSTRLGDTFINSGRDTYTRAYNDAGVQMRACGKAGDRAQIACTPWY